MSEIGVIKVESLRVLFLRIAAIGVSPIEKMMIVPKIAKGKMMRASICFTLRLLFKKCFNSICFEDAWANVLKSTQLYLYSYDQYIIYLLQVSLPIFKILI